MEDGGWGDAGPYAVMHVPDPHAPCVCTAPQLPEAERQNPEPYPPAPQLPEAERQGVPHHLIDIRDFTEDFSSGDFYDCARPVTDDILQVGVTRGRSGRPVARRRGATAAATPCARAAVRAAARRCGAVHGRRADQN